MSIKVNSVIKKWGNGLGMRISGPMRELLNLSADTPVSVEVFEDGFIVKKLPNQTKFSEDELLASLSSDNAHEELVTDLTDSEWAAPHE